MYAIRLLVISIVAVGFIAGVGALADMGVPPFITGGLLLGGGAFLVARRLLSRGNSGGTGAEGGEVRLTNIRPGVDDPSTPSGSVETYAVVRPAKKRGR